jgi:putative Ca2+/H+ antiporter (TMEM165/GDT1 family)
MKPSTATLFILLNLILLSTCLRFSRELDLSDTAVSDGQTVTPLTNPIKSRNYIETTTTLFFSSLFDRSFFIIAFMAIRYSKMAVLISATLALSSMGLLSVLLGVEITQNIPTFWIDTCAVLLFFFFGFKMIIEGLYMPKTDEIIIDKIEEEHKQQLVIGTDVENVGNLDATAIENNINNNNEQTNTTCENIKTFLRIFLLILVSELGDRSQIYMIYLTTDYDRFTVCVGVVISQTLITIIAVFGGRFIAKYLSERNLTLLAGLTFLLFGFYALYIMTQEYDLMRPGFTNPQQNKKNNLLIPPHSVLLKR